MRLAMMLPPRPDRRWAVARQMGVEAAVAKLAPELTDDAPPWDFEAMRRGVERYRAGGFTVVGLEGDQFDMDRIKRGLPGREEDLARYRQMLANMGRLGIPLICYNFMAVLGWYRTRTAVPGRGGAHVSAFDIAEAEAQGVAGEVKAEQLWDAYRHFLASVLPAAEQAGVRLALHPDDPPIPSLRGIGRIFCDLAGIERALALSESSSHALTFCQANYRLMGEDIPAVARRLAPRIAFIHVRDVAGTPGHFTETFPEAGMTDMAAAFRAYRDIGFTGPIRPDHAPAMEGDPVHGGAGGGISVGYEANGMIFTVGYMKGLAQAAGIRLA